MKKITSSLIWAMRPYQWIKGLFIFLPIIFGKVLFEPLVFVKTLMVFIGFNLVSSSIYILNDMVDLSDDQAHPQKSSRPLAAGKITVRQSAVLSWVLCVIGICLCFTLSTQVGWVVIAYLIANLLYAFYLKHIEIIDVFCIALFYYFRILVGGIIGGIYLSNWIILCTCLLALFLGFNKRKGDLILGHDSRPVLKKYNAYFIDRMISIISTSMVVIYAVYVMDYATIARFGTNNLLYTIPFVYYGIFRYIYLIDTKSIKIGGDPITILYKDWKLQLNVLIWVTFCIVVIYS